MKKLTRKEHFRKKRRHQTLTRKKTPNLIKPSDVITRVQTFPAPHVAPVAVFSTQRSEQNSKIFKKSPARLGNS